MNILKMYCFSIFLIKIYKHYIFIVWCFVRLIFFFTTAWCLLSWLWQSWIQEGKWLILKGLKLIFTDILFKNMPIILSHVTFSYVEANIFHRFKNCTNLSRNAKVWPSLIVPSHTGLQKHLAWLKCCGRLV